MSIGRAAFPVAKAGMRCSPVAKSTLTIRSRMIQYAYVEEIARGGPRADCTPKTTYVKAVVDCKLKRPKASVWFKTLLMERENSQVAAVA
jgi:UTP-glucose-1-phosphate uridylyltransferase